MVYLYRREIPKQDDLVQTIVTNVDEYGITVILPEYNDKPGFITFTEMSRKKRLDSDIRRLISIGNETIMLVIGVDEQKGYIDLSKRDVKETEVKYYNEKVRYHKTLYNLFKYVFLKLKNLDDMDLISDTESHAFLCNTLFDIQDESKLESEVILNLILDKEQNYSILKNIDFDNIEYNIDQIKQIIDNYIDTKINIKKSSETINFRMMSYEINGNSDIKYALDYKNFEFYPQISQCFDVDINYVSASNYSMILNQKELNVGDIKNCIELLIKEINKRSAEKKIRLK